MALPANFLEELRARLPVAGVIGRTVKLSRSGRERKGCCPFHGEKTPSFYVYDDHYHCFGCGAHGDVITFTMKTGGLSFMEAVQDLAAQAGLEVPKPTPQAAAAEARRASLAEVLEAACREYQLWLWGQEGRAALAYLRGRGLQDETIRRFQLGWSGEGRGALAAALAGRGVSAAQLAEAGLMKASERGPVDMFFSRVMFPIRDRRGGLISFGGRIIGEGQPKYVNGPETALFAKRRALYGLSLAREAVRQGAALIVAEGYMDVIALAQAGFGGAVAPLGTALTEEHLETLWQISPEPVICFDGDAAGQRAALRAAELALAHLTPERSLKILRLPPQDDPDSLIRRGGPAGFAAALAAAEPLAAALYALARAEMAGRTPEGIARFKDRLSALARAIPHKSLATEYWTALKTRFEAEFHPEWARRRMAGPGGAAPRRTGPPPPPEPGAADLRRARLMLAILLEFPALIPELEEAFSHVRLPPEDEPLRAAMHEFSAASHGLDSGALLAHLGDLGLDGRAAAIRALAQKELRLLQGASPAEAARSWWSFYELMEFGVGMLRAECAEAEAAWLANPDDRAACDRLLRYRLLLTRAIANDAGA